MNRNWSTTAQILSVKQSGEDNRSVTMLTKDKGIVRATLYGGPKSRLRSLVAPYHSGTIWLYTDEVKKSTKITDFDVISYRSEIRESLFKTCAAGLCAELAVKTHSGAEFAETWLYISSFLDGLCIVSEQESKIALLRFLWRFLSLLGFQPDPCHCERCGEEMCLISSSAKVFYSLHDSAFYCTECSMQYSDNPGFLLNKESVSYLKAVTTEKPGFVRNLKVQNETILELQDFLLHLIQSFVEGKLMSLDLLQRF